MEEKKLIIRIAGTVIGILVFIVGLYYLFKEGKRDAESKKIYTIISAIGAVVALGFGISLIFIG